MAQFEGDRGFVRWDGEADSYQNYYIVGVDGWTCIVTIPRSMITKDATDIFYLQVVLQGIFLLFIIYLCVQAYLADRRNRQAVDCFEALGQTYFCVALTDTQGQSCEVIKAEDARASQWKGFHSYEQFLALLRESMCREEDWA